MITETTPSGQVLGEYIYLGDQLLAMIRPGEVAYYFHNDHLVTPQVLTNDSQAIAWKAAYTSFGQAVPSIQTVENLFRFPGQYYDSETGLHYNYFRYYDPTTGRYVTPDPIGLGGGINLMSYLDNLIKPFDANLYTYVTGNPVRWVDPSGLDTEYPILRCHAVTHNDPGENLIGGMLLGGLAVALSGGGEILLYTYLAHPNFWNNFLLGFLTPGPSRGAGGYGTLAKTACDYAYDCWETRYDPPINDNPADDPAECAKCH